MGQGAGPDPDCGRQFSMRLRSCGDGYQYLAFYINGYEPARNHIEEIVQKTYPGSEHNYIGGNQQGDAPLMNSECGNVWGIDGGAGDSDLAWHYRYMLNEFRRHDKLCGFVFTEFRDVTNEFNGYYRLDGTDKNLGTRILCRA